MFITLTLILNNKIYHKVRTVPKSNWNRTELEKKYAPAIDNYGQSCFVRSDFLKMKYSFIFEILFKILSILDAILTNFIVFAPTHLLEDRD
jgi:hypothetical protein